MYDSTRGAIRLMKPIVIVVVVVVVYNMVMLKTSWINLTNLIFYGRLCLVIIAILMYEESPAFRKA